MTSEDILRVGWQYWGKNRESHKNVFGLAAVGRHIQYTNFNNMSDYNRTFSKTLTSIASSNCLQRQLLNTQSIHFWNLEHSYHFSQFVSNQTKNLLVNHSFEFSYSGFDRLTWILTDAELLLFVEGISRFSIVSFRSWRKNALRKRLKVSPTAIVNVPLHGCPSLIDAQVRLLLRVSDDDSTLPS